MSLLPVAEAQARLLAGVAPTEAVVVPLAEADGRVLAADLAALRTQPPFAASAMDGYAVRAADLDPLRPLAVIGEAPAGHHFAGTVGMGEAVRIFTGAPIPAGADTVLIQENARRDGATVLPTEAAPAGRFVRPAGLDFKAGAVLLTAGQRLGARQLALAAAMNHGSVPVRRRPRVAVIATGDELVAPGSEVGPDQIVASNDLAVGALVRAAGGEALRLGIVADDLDAIRARIRDGLAAGVDALVLLGGASVGDHDFTRAALEAEGVVLDFWKIAMRPGKPLMVGDRAGVRALGLPGNPVSSLVCATLFLEPLVRALLGQDPVLPSEEIAVATADLPANDQRQDYLRARLGRDADGRLTVTPFGLQDSSVLSVAAAADALLVRPPHAPAAPAGTPVPVLRLTA